MPINTPTPPRPDQLGPTEDLAREPDGIPHVLLGLGALVLVALAAMILLLVSGQAGTDRGATIALLFGVPAVIALVIAIGRRWRRPDQPHASR